MRSEGYGSLTVCVCVCVCVCVFVCPGRSSATHATKRQTRHTHGLSILLAPEKIWRFSYNGFVSKIAIAFPRGGCARPDNYVTCAIISILAHATQFNPLSQHLSIFVRFVSAVTLTCGILAAVRRFSVG